MGLVRLTTLDDGVESEMLCALLRSFDVRCISVAATTPGTTIGALGAGALARLSGDQFAPHDVLVQEDDLELAREILAAPVEETSAEPRD